MKIIDRYILKSFLVTFTTVFVILFFIFILYALWQFIPDLAGKDLSVWMVLKFLSFVMPTLVPLILPLTILLASIMTFGAFAENYEFAAMKSSGLSLGRISSSLAIFMVVLASVTFYFANDVIPYSKYKMNTFRRNLAQVKPAAAIMEGQFSEIGNFNIKVDKKSGENDRFLEGVIIHKRSQQGKNTTVTKSKSGELISSEDSNVLRLVLYDGHHYEEILSKDFKERRRVPFTKSDFEKYTINIDLSGLGGTDLEADTGEDANVMFNVSELKYVVDSLKTDYKKTEVSYIDNIHHKNTYSTFLANDSIVQNLAKIDQIIDVVPQAHHGRVYDIARNNMAGSKYNIRETINSLDYKYKEIKSYQYAIHEKFVLAYACLLMFFIGAPLGAIIRKGGFGLPIVFAIIIFVAYHFMNTFGRKIAQDGSLDAFTGAWGSSIILTPLALILTYRATNDKGMSLERFFEPIQNLFKKIFKRKQNV